MPSRSSHGTEPSSRTVENTGGTVQEERATSAMSPAGRTRATLAASPPPVMWDRAWIGPGGGRRGEGLQHGQAHAGVQTRGLEQLLAQGAPELGDLALQAPAGVVDDAAHQGVTVGVQAGGA